MCRVLLVLVLLICLPAALQAQGVETGSEAFRRGNYATARAIWEPLAEGGNRMAQYNLGIMHQHGLGTEPDIALAAKWFMRAANAGHAKAQEMVADLYSSGVISDGPDAASAAKWYKRAAERGLASAQRKLGILFATGFGVNEDRKEAMKWLRRAGKKGDPNAKAWITAFQNSDNPGGVQQNKTREQLKAGIAAYRQGRYAEALAIMDKLAALQVPEAEHWLEIVQAAPAVRRDPNAEHSVACVSYLMAQSRESDIEAECEGVRSDTCVNHFVQNGRGYDIHEQCSGVYSDTCVDMLVSHGRGHSISAECKGELSDACMRHFADNNRVHDAAAACRGVTSEKCVQYFISQNKAYNITTQCKSVESDACVEYLVAQNRAHEIASLCGKVKSEACVQHLISEGRPYDIGSDCRNVSSDECVRLIIAKNQWENVQLYCAIE